MKTVNSRQIDSVRSLLMFLVHHVETLGVSAAEINKAARLSQGWLESMELADFVAAVPRVISAALKLTGDSHLLLHAGERFHFCLGGLGGFAAIHAPTPTLALHVFGRNVNVDELLEVTVSIGENETAFGFEVATLWPKRVREQIADGLLSGTAAALAGVSGGVCKPIYAKLARSEPRGSTEYHRVLHCQARFGTGDNEIAFKNEELSAPSPLYDQLLYEQLSYAAELRTAEPSVAGPLRQLVEQCLRSGADSIMDVAELLRMNTRTLQRRLQGEGVSFREIHSEVKIEMAKKLLRETSASLPDIAWRLNYTDGAALRKAIKRVTGKTPTELRQDLDQG